MRKFFSIVLYIFAGIFSAALIATICMPSMNHLSSTVMFATFGVIFVFATVFFTLASLLYPEKNYHKPVYITLISSVVIMLMSGVNQYFIVKGLQKSQIDTKMTKVLTQTDYTCNLYLGGSVLVVLLIISFYFYRRSIKHLQ